MTRENNAEIVDSYRRVMRSLIRRDLAGYDPYDGNHSRIATLRKFYATRLALTYVNKFSPVNLRPLFRILPSRNNQATAFVLRALALCSPGDLNVFEFIRREADRLLANALRGEEGTFAWAGLEFSVQMRFPKVPRAANVPDVIATEACARVFLECRGFLPETDTLEVAAGAASYLMNNHYVENRQAAFFKYYPGDPPEKVTYNATALAATFVARVGALIGDAALLDAAERCWQFLVDKQHPEGFWNYRINLESGDEKPQVDFHQGFILDALLEFMEIRGVEEPWSDAFERGIRFYRDHQFLDSGQGIYRYPRKWPVNIHNQAQGILTFCRAGWLDAEYRGFAAKVADWTIRNMQDDEGFFYYLKYPFFTNKISYPRWSDAAMGYALATLAKALVPFEQSGRMAPGTAWEQMN